MDYRLDLRTLLLMLKQQSGDLNAEVPHIPGIKGACQVFLRLEFGMVQSCLIRNGQGSEVKGAASLIKRIQNQVLEWHFKEERSMTQPLRQYPSGNLPAPGHSETSSHPAMIPLSFSSVPYRLRIASREEFLTWPRPYRTVYSLIDGKSSVDDIVRLLARDQGREQILEMLKNLYRENLIAFEGDGQGSSTF